MPKTVLIIEDEPDIAEALKMLIEMNGHRAIVAPDGQEGSDLARAERFDLILMDLSMPRKDGLDATREIRACAENADTPIVGVTSFATPEKRLELLQAGCAEVFTKTAFMASFEKTLEKYLGPPA
jgi:DNA-binding response OmpR family regulator